MNVTEAVEYINAHTWSQWKLGLSRTEDLLRLLGDPQKSLRFVHVAGSNGKGSTCAMVERILREAGYVTGFYPSPYIEDFRERIQVCGEYITEEALCRITARVRDAADSMEDHPSQFEIITAIGMVYFAEKNCDLVVLEVGLGGTYDSTNIIDAPEVAVITNIGLEHTEYLGDTLAEIAGNKCGIIKPGADVVCYENAPEVMEVVRRTCADRGCPLRIARYGRILPLEKSFAGQTFRFLPEKDEPGRDPEIFRLALLGEYQLHNAATALTVVEVLRRRGWKIPVDAVRRGLANVRWPARFEVLSSDPLFILDGGHNPQCAEALAESLREYLPLTGSSEVVFLMGMLADKDYEAVIDTIAPFAAGFVCLTPDSPRALPGEELAAALRKRGLPAQACASAEEGILAALQEGTVRELAPARQAAHSLPVVSFGSLYMAGAVRHAFPKARKEYILFCKNRQRREAMDKRRALTDEERARKSASVCRLLAGLPQLQQARTVFTYAAAWDEVNLDEINRVMEEQGKRVAYPISGKNGVMTAVLPGAGTGHVCGSGDFGSGGSPCREWQGEEKGPGKPMGRREEEGSGISLCRGEKGTDNIPGGQIWRTGVFGIREPVAELAVEVDPAQIDAVLVPCVVFDRQGGRCGHGAGYYDRFLARLSPEVPKILIAFDAQEVAEVAVEETDVRMDLVVTESGLTSCF